MRCPNCNRFVSLETEDDPDVRVDVSAEGGVDGTVTIANACAECGTELTSAEFSVELDFTDNVQKHRASLKEKKEEHESLELEFEPTRTERTQTHDRHGKKLSGPSRYRKHYYGAEGEVIVRCECGEVLASAFWKDEIQASGMDSLV